MPRLRRRELIATGAAGALASAAPAAARARARTYDVVVVGAGLAGLSAARKIRAAGRSVLVLEARGRVGGRNFDHALPANAGVVELGGQGAGPGQDKVLALAKEFGIDTFETYAQGSSIYYAGGQKQTYSGDIPPASPAALAEVEASILQLNQMASSVDANTPWSAPQAHDWDEQSVASWFDANNHTAEARALGRVAVRGIYGEDAELVSLLDLLSAISGVGGDFNTLIGDAQTIRFVGGPQQFSQRLAKLLSRAIRLHSAVVAVEWHGSVAVVHTSKEAFKARRVVLALPKPLLGRLRFDPPLAPAWDQLLQRQPMGSVLKFNAIYDDPFWRSDGLNGVVVSDQGPVSLTYDNCPPSGKPGVLVGFAEGNESRGLYGLSADKRKAAVLECLVRYFGERAGRPSDYVEVLWATAPFTRGAYGSYNPPGVITSLGAATSAGSVGPLHVAGADWSPQWPGYMDGAIRSGEKTAEQIIASL
ncbi:MAG: monoamine oxidase [Thermoleophilaceae bacterium]|nr:monoamine oxidase [Thermoleophilaceae bacterium]